MNSSIPSQYVKLRIAGLIGSILMIISEFIPWFSSFSLFTILLYSSSLSIENAYLYIFPLIGGSICAIGSISILKRPDYKINAAIINIIGLSFLLLFLFFIIPNELLYLSDAGIGFYVCIAGFFLVIIEIMSILLVKETSQEGI